jgi:enoyl-CoA hydratase
MIEVEHDGGVRVVRLAHGKVNALDLELTEALVDHFDHLAEATDVRALVLAGTTRGFSAGVDLRRIVDGGAPYVERFLPALAHAFVSLFNLPMPVVAAVNGYAIAGGCILAAACDHRVLARGGRIGASELQVGVPYPVAALEVLAHACGRHVEEVVFGAALFTDDEAVRVGLAHEVVDGDVVLARALEVARSLAAIGPDAYRMAKQQLRRSTVGRIEQDQPLLDPLTVEVWGSAATAAVIRSHLDRIAAG